MKRHRLLIAFAVLSLALAACGGAAATQAPAGGGGGQPTTGAEPTDAAQATQSGGGGGGGGNTGGGSGQIHIDIGGPVQATVDQPFFAFGSRFGGPAGVALNFTSDGATGIASVGGQNDQWVVSWVGDGLLANATNCALTNWNIGATSGSGSFDCKEGFATKEDGTYLTGVTMKGSFQASQ